jgi:hypothetical protein
MRESNAPSATRLPSESSAPITRSRSSVFVARTRLMYASSPRRISSCREEGKNFDLTKIMTDSMNPGKGDEKVSEKHPLLHTAALVNSLIVHAAARTRFICTNPLWPHCPMRD